MNLICYANKKEKICLAFFPCINHGENISWEEWHLKEPLTIFKTDYQELLMEYLVDMFPLFDPTNGEKQEIFDVCFDNWIGKNDWIHLIAKIRNDFNLSQNTPTISFYNKFIGWLEDQFEWADIIVVSGNQ